MSRVGTRHLRSASTRGRRRPRLTYANVTSTVALFLALGTGTAYAATYVITSVGQIKPSVRAELRSPELHAYNGSSTILPYKAKSITPIQLTTLALPPHSAALVHAKVQLFLAGTGGTNDYASCFLYVSSVLYDTSAVIGAVGDETTVPLELSVPAQTGRVSAIVECRLNPTAGDKGNDVVASSVQEDAVLLQ